MVEKLFYSDPYLKEAEARVLRLEGRKVWLDRTIFFAFSGGQASDSGRLGGVALEDVVKEGEDIVHVLAEEPGFREGDSVRLELDWERRQRLMRLHSAAHIVYSLLSRKIGNARIIGSNISPDKARIDFEHAASIKEFLPMVEEKANQMIEDGYPIETYEDHAEKGKRWWKLNLGLTVLEMPCGGLHVRNSSEIGKLKLRRVNIGKGKERVEVALA